MSLILRAGLAALLVAAAGCSADPPYVPSPMTGEPTPTYPPEDAWARVLKSAVDAQGAVDFDALLANHADLDRYVAWIYQRSPDRWPNLYKTRAHELAYHVNAYNALTLYNYLLSGLPRSFSLLERRQFFQTRKLFVGGRPLSLDEYRDQVIRPLGDPRLLLAITRHLQTDPVLAREPYRAATLEAQLDRAARAFMADERNVRVDAAGRSVTLAPVLETYAESFKAGPSLLEFVNRFRDRPVPADYEVEYAGTDWNVRRAGK